MTRGEELFRRLVEGGEAEIDRLIAARKAEELFLDFKRSANNGQGPRLVEGDRNNLAKCLSGFANSEGGVIVWGVDCREGRDYADVAQAKVPLENPVAFASWIEGTVSSCTIPPCGSTQSHPIETSDGRGFVVTLVKKSNRAPHQVVGGNLYYIRAGSAFVPAPHAVLAGMFGRRPEPFVFHQFVTEPPRLSPDSGKINCTFGILLINDGPGVARDVFLASDYFFPGGIKVEYEEAAPDAFDSHSLLRVHTALMSKPGFRLPPGGRVSPVTYGVEFDVSIQGDLTWTWVYGCEGAPTKEHRIEHKRDTLENLLNTLSTNATDQEATAKFAEAFLGAGCGDLRERQPFVGAR